MLAPVDGARKLRTGTNRSRAKERLQLSASYKHANMVYAAPSCLANLVLVKRTSPTIALTEAKNVQAALASVSAWLRSVML